MEPSSRPGRANTKAAIAKRSLTLAKPGWLPRDQSLATNRTNHRDQAKANFGNILHQKARLVGSPVSQKPLLAPASCNNDFNKSIREVG